MAAELEPTTEEARAIASLQRLSRRWPDSLYLASMAGCLHVMRKGEDGGHAMQPDGYSLAPSYSLATIPIDSTGGDW